MRRIMKKILLVDDEADLVALLESKLRNIGYQVITAQDGLDGLNKARNDLPDLIILDVMMPKINGYTICGLLKANDQYRSIPIIMLTARSRKVDQTFDSATKPDVYITKPFDSNLLLDKIEHLVNAG